MPGLRPSADAAAFMAHSRSADFTGVTTMRGASSGADERRASRSVGSRGSHTDR
jgi:hypothetical protein